MSSIYGWLSKSNDLAANTSLIHKQYSANKCVSSDTSFFYHTTASAEIGGHSFHSTAALSQSENLLTALAGNPSWTDHKLAAIADHQGPAQALAKGFEKFGAQVINHIRGAFSLCILKPDKHYALLAVDRLGIHPLAYYYQNGLLVFGSQLDSIRAHPGVKTTIDPQGIFNYLYFHMIPSPGTIYTGIYKLQPGEFFELKNEKSHRDYYWRPSYSDSTQSKAELGAQLRFQLEQSTIACKPDQHTGTFLSGGLDSSTVTGFWQKLASSRIDAFTMGFAAKGYDEMEYARSAAKHFGVNLHEYYVTPTDVLNAIPLIAQTYDEPFGNASAIPTYYCAKFARENGMNRLLAGDGGDEIFAGNSRYAKQKIFDLYRNIPSIIKSAIEPIAFNLPFLGKIKSYVKQAKIPMPDRLETYNFLHRTALSDIFQPDFLQQINPNQPLQNLRNTYQRLSSDDLLKKMLFLDGKFTLADNDLRKVNRMCELAGMNVQYPMLDENLVEFAASIPSKWLMQGFELRSFYRHALKDFLPQETLKKNKQGFGLPFGVWMNTDKELKAFAEASLNGIEKRNFLNPDYIKNLIYLHQTGHASYYGVMIWILVMLEQWLISHNP